MVFRKVILSIIAFYTFFALTNIMSFGNDVRTVLTTSLPAGALATSVQLAYSVAVIFTFPLQNFPALEITTRSLEAYLNTLLPLLSKNKSPFRFWLLQWLKQRHVISTLMVCILAMIAVVTMDSLDKVVSLMGSLLGAPIAFIFPPLIHIKLKAAAAAAGVGGPPMSVARKVGNVTIVGMGFTASVLASATTILTWNE